MKQTCFRNPAAGSLDFSVHRVGGRLSQIENTGKKQASAQTRVSVAMATYNGSKYIRQQLESIAAQSYLPCELVVTDDGSNDTTLQIIQDFAATAPFPIRISPNERRLGYADNFLRAASLCEGDIIAFCDQDDVWEPSKLAICTKEFSDPEVMLCVHSGRLWYGGDRFGNKCPGYLGRRESEPLGIYPLRSSYGFAMVFRRTLLSITDNQDRIPSLPEDLPMAHDQWIWLLASVFGKIVTLPDVLVRYRQHEAQFVGGEEAGLSNSLVGAVSTHDYGVPAIMEMRAANLMTKISRACADQWRSKAEAGARFLARCSETNAVRLKIHGETTRFSERLSLFLSILSKKGYSFDSFAARLGYRAALKDFVLGVAGAGRILRLRRTVRVSS
jgi:glycosyltransferase involved in cell wall biosynthesis